MSIKKEEKVEYSDETIQNIKLKPYSGEMNKIRANGPFLKIRRLPGDRLSKRKNSLKHAKPSNFYVIDDAANAEHEEMLARLILNRGRYLRALTCSGNYINSLNSSFLNLYSITVCESNFYVFDFYIHHLRIEHKVQHERCRFCSELHPIDELISHFSTHNIGIFECLYCSFGTNNFSTIVMHLWKEHPSNSLHIVLRLSKKSECNVSIPCKICRTNY